MALRRVSEAPRMMHCLWAGVSFQQLINGEQSYRQLPSHCGGTPGPNWMSATGKRKGAQLLDGVELSHRDISFWHRVYFASQHTSRKWELSTAAALGNHCHFPTRHINKSKQTTLLYNLRLRTEYDPNIKHSCKYFRGRGRFGWYWKWNTSSSSLGLLHINLYVMVMQLLSHSQQPSYPMQPLTLYPLPCPNGGKARLSLLSIQHLIFINQA